MPVAGTRALFFLGLCGFAEQCSGQRFQCSPSTALQSLPFDVQAAGALSPCTVGGVQGVLGLAGVHALQPVLVHPLHVQVALGQPDRNGRVQLLHPRQQRSVCSAILTLGLALAIQAPLGRRNKWKRWKVMEIWYVKKVSVNSEFFFHTSLKEGFFKLPPTLL